MRECRREGGGKRGKGECVCVSERGGKCVCVRVSVRREGGRGMCVNIRVRACKGWSVWVREGDRGRVRGDWPP